MPDEPTYAHLLTRLRQGDRDAQTLVFERYVQDLIRSAQAHLRKLPKLKVGASAVVQSALLSFFENHLPDTADLEADGLWGLLLENTLRHCEKWNKRFRAQKRRTPEVSINAPDGKGTALDLADAGPGPEDQVAETDYLVYLFRELDARLTERQRQVLLLRQTGATVREIAEQLGTSKATVDREWKEILRRAQAIARRADGGDVAENSSSLDPA
jgi:RNA polymerase sigma factor (sigma-70 family)